ncbi:MAG: hypothetical protein J6Z11_12435, partial [Candidatus Riflebacteria bacterium]|nr:hypothetical protein [Candidatus Riflebacteria bacterium]
MTKFKYLLFLLYLVLFTTNVYAMAPTVQVEGHWESVNPFFIVQATIDGKSERVRLPKLTF